MRVFLVEYHWSGRYQTFCEYTYLIVTETPETALGMVIEKTNLDPKYLSVREINTTDYYFEQVHYDEH